MSRKHPMRLATPNRPQNFKLLSVKDVKLKSGIGTVYYKPLMDWDLIRRGKVQCEERCNSFSTLYGSCLFNLLPGIDCKISIPENPQKTKSGHRKR